jgi:hypothetical protein
MKNLKDLSIKLGYPTDKDTSHNYLPAYQEELNITENIKFLELGVYTGGSLRLWEEYFHNSEIHGIECTMWDKSITIPGIMHWGKYEELHEEFENEYFDYIINDSMHNAEEQIKAFKLYYSKLKFGGKFFMEDIPDTEHLSTIVKELEGLTFKVWNMNSISNSQDSIILVVYKN